MRTIAICDDSWAWLERAAGILEAFLENRGGEASEENERPNSDLSRECGADFRVVCYDDIDRCVGELPQDAELLFMDIEWEERTDGAEEPGSAVKKQTGAVLGADSPAPKGIDAVRRINEKYPELPVVYLTNHLGYAIDVYQTEHAWYVIKEQFEDRLPEVFEKLERKKEDRRAELVMDTTDGRTVRIPCRDILYIERKGRKSEIKVCVYGREKNTDTYNNEEKSTDEVRTYEVRDRIPEVMKMLPAAGFARCHNSIIVNLEKVSEIKGGTVTLDGGTELLISRGHSREFRTAYMKWAKSRVL